MIARALLIGLLVACTLGTEAAHVLAGDVGWMAEPVPAEVVETAERLEARVVDAPSLVRAPLAGGEIVRVPGAGVCSRGLDAPPLPPPEA